MAELYKEQSLAERDPAQIRWAVRDLYDINDLRWNGGNAVIPPETFARYRDAAKIVMHAYNSANLSVSTEPELMDEQPRLTLVLVDEQPSAEEQSLSVAERLEQDIAFAAAYNLLRTVIDDALEELDDYEWLGPGEDPIGAIRTKLHANLNKAEFKSGPFLDRLLDETPESLDDEGYPIVDDSAE